MSSSSGSMQKLEIDQTVIEDGHVYVIAEMSANHGQSLDRALETIGAAHDAGADAIKLQTYRPESITIDCDHPRFRVGAGTLWSGRTLIDLYREAVTPWEWHPELFAEAARIGITIFSSPFDLEAVRFLDALGAPAFKIASFEIVDHALIAAAAATGKPLVISTGMATEDEIDEAVSIGRGGSGGVALLRCNSSYPADPGEMDLRTIPDMRARWGCPVGLSDHTPDSTSAVAAVALGAVLLEKHITMRRSNGGPDAAFSLEPDEFSTLVQQVRETERALGGIRYGPSPGEERSLAFRRSLFVVEDVQEGDVLTAAAVRSIRPAGGLAPKHLAQVIGQRATRRIDRGTPLDWTMVERAMAVERRGGAVSQRQHPAPGAERTWR